MGIFKLKNIIIIFLIIFMCGCKAEYKITVDDNKIKETGFLVESKSVINNSNIKEDIDYTYNNFYDKDTIQDREKKRSFNLSKIDNQDYYGFNYSNTYELDHFSDSPVLLQCYDKVNYINNQKFINITTSNTFKCFDYYKALDEVKIALNTSYSLTGNYDEADNDNYYWFVNKENYKDKKIEVSINKEMDISLNEEKSNKVINFIYIALGVVVLISTITIYFKVKKSSN